MSTLSWGELGLTEEVSALRMMPPRGSGITMVIDTGLGTGAVADILEVSSNWIDQWKLSFGTSVFVPDDVLRRKLEMINAAGITTFPGGTLFEAAIVRHHCRDYMARARSLGFTAVEVSDGTIDLPSDRRRRVVECGLEAGLEVITEVGKKDPTAQLTPLEMGEQAARDIEWGASWVVVEGRESGTGVGVFDSDGGIDMEAVETLAHAAGDHASKLVWEAPLKDQQSSLVGRFGINVGLGNIDPTRVLALEALRSGLRFETLKPIADRLRDEGDWEPEQVELADQAVIRELDT
jgi:phosphosulfolactate synthase